MIIELEKFLSENRNISKVIINQFYGIGDVLFIEPILKWLNDMGLKVILPIQDQNIWIQENITYVDFVKKSEFNIDYERFDYGLAVVDGQIKEDTLYLPTRFSEQIYQNRNSDDYDISRTCMTDKYRVLGLNTDMWKSLKFTRNYEKEQNLKNIILGDVEGEYDFCNIFYGGIDPGSNDISSKIKEERPLINLSVVHGYSLIDWCGIIEGATKVHTVSTSLLFVIQSIKNKSEYYIYPRLPEDVNLYNVEEFLPEYWNKIEYISVEKSGVNHIFPTNTKNFNFYKNQFKDWENQTFDVFEKVVEKNKVAIDIGAWVGTTSIWLSKNFKKVISFEPDVESLVELKENAVLNKCDNLIISDMAVFNKKDKILFGGYNGELNTSMSRIKNDNIFNEYEVNTITVNDIFEIFNVNINDVSFIKCDIEGSEEYIIEDLLNFIFDKEIDLLLSFHLPWFENKDLSRFEGIFNKFKGRMFSNDKLIESVSDFISNNNWESVFFSRKYNLNIFNFDKPYGEYPYGILKAEIDYSNQIPEEYFPLTFKSINNIDNQVKWQNDSMYFGYWSLFYSPQNTTSIIENSNGRIINTWKWDVTKHGDTTHRKFWNWCQKNKGSKGIAVGTHDGTTGEWVEPLILGIIEAVLVEASDIQYQNLFENYKDVKGCNLIQSLITTDGGEFEFYEDLSGDGQINSVSKEHLLKYTQNIKVTKKSSISLNDLVIQSGLKNDFKWLHLDVEGLDADLIMSLDEKIIRLPDMIIYESLNLQDGKGEKVINWLVDKGYSIVKTFLNTMAYK